MDGVDVVVRLRRTASGTDRYGLPTYTTTETELPKALFAPKHVVPAVEVGRQATIVEPTLYWPDQWPDVIPSDRLRVRGRVFEVNAEASSWKGHGVGGLVVVLKDSTDGAV